MPGDRQQALTFEWSAKRWAQDLVGQSLEKVLVPTAVHEELKELRECQGR
jgi:hypothetical protein